MTKELVKQAIEEYAERNLTTNVNLWPTVQQKLAKAELHTKRKTGQPTRLRFVGFTLAIVAIAVTFSLITFGALSKSTEQGVNFVLHTVDAKVGQAQLESVQQVVSKRLSWLGASSYKITLLSDSSFLIQAIGITNQAELAIVLTTPGRVEFIDAGNTQFSYGSKVQTSYCLTGSLYQPKAGLCSDNTSTPSANTKVYQTVITGAQIDPEKVSLGEDQNGATIINFGVKYEAATTLQNFTGSHIGQEMAVVFDGKVITEATIQAAIGTTGMITNPLYWNTEQGKSEANLVEMALKTGTLPINLTTGGSN